MSATPDETVVPVRAHRISKDDWIICPLHGNRELVTDYVEERPSDRVFIPVEGHDHVVHRFSVIELTEAPA